LIGYLLALRLGPWLLAKARRLATCSAGPVGQTVAFLHQIEAALARCAWQSLQNTPETRQEGCICCASYWRGYVSFNFEEKKMKNILLATTAIALTAGYAAADVSYSASAKLSYGNFGEKDLPDATYGYSNEFDFVITGSGEAGGVSYSGGMKVDEDGEGGLAAFTMSSNGLSYTYDANDLSGLETASATSNLDEAAGDWKIAYAANGFSAGYEVDEDIEGRYLTTVSYSANGISLGLEASDDDGKLTAKSTVNTVSVGYTMGAMAISYDVDDQTDQDYDAKVTYTMGDTVLSAGTDEVESHYAGISTSFGGLSLTARVEADGTTASGVTGENELSLSYTMGALSVAYAKDTGNNGDYGDEAETVTTITYDLGGVKLVAKGTDQDETEVSAAFSF
jgi:outer membrane protein OmpU